MKGKLGWTEVRDPVPPLPSIATALDRSVSVLAAGGANGRRCL